MPKDEIPDFLWAINEFLELLIDNFGPGGTIIIMLALVFFSLGFRVYKDRRRDKERDALIEEKDRTIQRLAASEREYRALFLKEKAGWTDEQVKSFIARNEFSDPVEARQALEGQQGNEDTGR